jgi:hypothetical protein
MAHRFDAPIEPMTLGNMRELGMRSLYVSCWSCQYQAVLTADRWSDDVAVPTFGPRAWSAPAAASSAPTPGRTGRSSRRGRTLTGVQWRG